MAAPLGRASPAYIVAAPWAFSYLTIMPQPTRSTAAAGAVIPNNNQHPTVQAHQTGNAAAQAQAQAQAATAAQQDALSVILVTGGYDNTIRFWEAWSGVCSRTINHQEHVRINRDFETTARARARRATLRHETLTGSNLYIYSK